ncbi:hypothetical protein HPB50_005760 [Hyalomma asiaticum]|uniref:Uncharacterized protein n=1 Tax=Hyalomma asiaticum TaxID=266040 RepID=A0ACB7T5U7_HYAAI|nr:hypothetical protein HPB50_005760 [Hyalomma asiaticum]
MSSPSRVTERSPEERPEPIVLTPVRQCCSRRLRGEAPEFSFIGSGQNLLTYERERCRHDIRSGASSHCSESANAARAFPRGLLRRCVELAGTLRARSESQRLR